MEAKTPATLNHPVFWLPGPHLPTHPTHLPLSPILLPRLLKPCQLSSALTSPHLCFSTLCLSLSSLCVLCLTLSLSSSFCLSPLLCHPFLVSFSFLLSLSLFCSVSSTHLAWVLPTLQTQSLSSLHPSLISCEGSSVRGSPPYIFYPSLSPPFLLSSSLPLWCLM